MSTGILPQGGREQLSRVPAADIQLSCSSLRFPLFEVWLMYNLNHSRVSPSIQVMAKGIIKQAGTHILDLQQESGEFFSPAKLSLSWEVRQLWQTYRLLPYKCRDPHLHVP